MADEDKTTTTTETTETIEPSQAAGQGEPVRPHPLEEGGVRFNEVIAEKNQYKAEAQVLRERLAALEAKPAEVKPPPTFYTPEQLQASVDAGRITPAQMSNQLAWQQAQAMKQEIVKEATQQQRAATAAQEIRTYLDRIPALNNQSSPEFTKVSRAAWDIGEDLGLPVSDPRVQRRALREVFGTPDKLTETTRTQEFSRQASNTHTEFSGGGGSMTGTPSQADPLKGVDRRYIEHWERLGYTRERMLAEAKYIKRPFPGYRDAIHGEGAKKV